MPMWIKVLSNYRRTRGGTHSLFTSRRLLNRGIESGEIHLVDGPVRPGLIGATIARYIPVNFVASNEDVNTGDW